MRGAEAGEELVLSLAQPHPGYDGRPKGPRGAWGHEAAEPRDGHTGGHADSAPARRPLTPPMAPHGMLDERPPALRPGAPAFFWQALQVRPCAAPALSPVLCRSSSKL